MTMHDSATIRTGRRAARLAVATSLLFAGLTFATPSDLVRETNLRRGAAAEADRFHLDRIDRFNGNLALAVPLGNDYPASASFSYRFNVSYNSQIWDFLPRTLASGSEVVAAEPRADSNAGLGWDLSFGRLFPPSVPGNPMPNWIFVERHGQRHVLYDSARPGDSPHSTRRFSRDGSYLRMQLRSDGKREVRYPDGRRLIFVSADDDWELEQVRDGRTSRLLITRSADDTSLTIDDRYRTHTVVFQDDPTGTYPRLIQRLDLSAFGNTTASFVFEYVTVDLPRPVSDTDPDTPATVSVPLLSRIVQPDGTTYEMTTVASGAAAGMLSSLDLPTLGRLSWAYQSWSFPWLDCVPGQHVHLADIVGIATRSTVDKQGNPVGTWTYTPAGNIVRPTAATCDQPTDLRVSVVDPLGHTWRHFFSTYVSGDDNAASGTWSASEYGLPFTRAFAPAPGLQTSTIVIEGATKVRSYLTAHELDTFTDCPSDCVGSNARVRTARTVFDDDSGSFVQVDRSGYGGYGRYATTAEWSSFPDDVTITETIDLHHETGRWWLNQTDRVERTRDTETHVVDYCIEPYGKVTRERTLAGTTEGPDDVIVAYDLDSFHQPVAVRYHGGGGQSVPNGDLCTLTLPTAQVEVVNTYDAGQRSSSHFTAADGTPLLFTLDQDIDLASGLVERSRDSAGLATERDYDELGRHTATRPSGGHGAWVDHHFNNATATSGATRLSVARANGGGDTLRESREELDDFGRMVRKGRKLPDGRWSDEQTLYNEAGLVARTHGPGSESATGGYRDYLNHDAFGRPRRVVDAAGGETNTVFHGQRERIISSMRGVYYQPHNGLVVEAPVITSEVFDRQRRVVERTQERYFEPYLSTPPETITTTYTFDLGGHIVSTHVDGEQAGPISTFDGRGFLLSEMPHYTSPEAPAVYSNHTVLGRYGRKVTGTVDLTFDHDRAGRLVAVYETGDPALLWKEFVYATANSGTNWTQGKLTSRTGRNFYPWGSNSTLVGGELEVKEHMTYGGRGGRVSEITTTLSDLAGVRHRFSQGFDYDDLGAVETMAYPQCTMCDGAAPGPDRHVMFDYDLGWLTSVGGTLDGVTQPWITNIAYDEHGLESQIVHDNGVVMDFAAGPSGFDRAGSATADGYLGTYQYDSGAFEYDSGGRLVRIGDLYNVPLSENRLPWGGVLSPAPAACPTDPFGRVQLAGSSKATPPCGAGIFAYDADDRLVYEESLEAPSSQAATFYDLEDREIRRWVTTTAGTEWVATNDEIHRPDALVGEQTVSANGDLDFAHYAHGLAARATRIGAPILPTHASPPPTAVSNVADLDFLQGPLEKMGSLCPFGGTIPCPADYGYVGGCTFPTQQLNDRCDNFGQTGQSNAPNPLDGGDAQAQECRTQCLACCNAYYEQIPDEVVPYLALACDAILAHRGAGGYQRTDLYRIVRDAAVEFAIDIGEGLLFELLDADQDELLRLALTCNDLAEFAQDIVNGTAQDACRADCTQAYSYGSCIGTDSQPIEAAGTPQGGPRIERNRTCSRWTWTEGQNKWRCRAEKDEDIIKPRVSCTLDERCGADGEVENRIYICNVNGEESGGGSRGILRQTPPEDPWGGSPCLRERVTTSNDFGETVSSSRRLYCPPPGR